jgi:hypothetical protein
VPPGGGGLVIIIILNNVAKYLKDRDFDDNAIIEKKK